MPGDINARLARAEETIGRWGGPDRWSGCDPAVRSAVAGFGLEAAQRAAASAPALGRKSDPRYEQSALDAVSALEYRLAFDGLLSPGLDDEQRAKVGRIVGEMTAALPPVPVGVDVGPDA